MIQQENLNKVKVSVVIPARNEAEGIQKIVREAHLYSGEVIVIDGHSTDKTGVLAEEAGALVFQDNGRGKGAAYKLGIQKSSGEIVVFVDADGSHNLSDIPKLVKPILEKQCDLVIASRFKGGSDEWEGDFETYARHVGSGILTLVINYRWGAHLTDCLNGFRALNRQVALKVPFYADNFDIEQHMIAQCLKYGYRVTEVGSHEFCRAWGISKLPTFKKAYLFFWRLFLDLINPK